MECFICGVKGEDAVLFSAIVKEGVVPVCEACSLKEKILIIKRVGQLRESERNQTVYERLSHMAGLNPVEHKEKIKQEERIELRRQETRKPAEKKNLSYPNLKQIKPQFEEGLVRNYHWTIFNARRAMKLTQKQLADEIGEPEASVKLVERGILPDNYLPFIRKLQTYLRVALFDNQLKKDFNLDKSNTKLAPKNVSEEESRVPYWKRLGFLQRNREKRQNQEPEENEEREEMNGMRKLSQEEIDKITFGQESSEDK
ncbi:MAG: hypothetical protein Q8O84_00120 [Nanoarchaeota archaeon]|nr:hypothetical protein [Nanoarchaeota archaeon]MDP3758238.1 hypothetical protein [Candidatus Daviesbacteria bacterium]